MTSSATEAAPSGVAIYVARASIFASLGFSHFLTTPNAAKPETAAAPIIDPIVSPVT